MSDNTALLWAFCAAARHSETCASWQAHRELLDTEAEFITKMIEVIPNAIAIGKASQKAATQGQGVLVGETPVVPPVIVDHRNPLLPPVRIDWKPVSLGMDGDYEYPICWVTGDTHVGAYVPYEYKQDVRSRSIAAYKPRQVEIYFDGEPDEWNGKR